MVDVSDSQSIYGAIYARSHQNISEILVQNGRGVKIVLTSNQQRSQHIDNAESAAGGNATARHLRIPSADFLEIQA